MLMALLAGLFTGFGLAIPPGPINFAVFEKGIADHRKTARRIVLGGVTGDALFCTLAILYQLSTEWLDWLKVMLSLLGGLFLVIMGIHYIHRGSNPAPPEALLRAERAHQGHFYKGLFIALSNPFLILAVIAVTEVYYSLGLLRPHAGTNLMFILGFQVGTFFWMEILAHFAARTRHIFEERKHRVKSWCGWAYLAFGLYMLGKFVRLIVFHS